MTQIRKIAIVGVGPRGGYSLEQIIYELAKQRGLTKLHISLFEATEHVGNGPVYNLQQNSSNWINITERVLELPARNTLDTHEFSIPAFPSYLDWIGKDFNTLPKDTIDTFPPRSDIGKYLSERFLSLSEPLIKSGVVSLYKEQAEEIHLLQSDKVQVISNNKAYHEFDELLLTIGHQITELDQQILEWDKFAKDKGHLHLFQSAYPTNTYLQLESLDKDSTIAIRGFGLAMIDVVRAIACKFGKFTVENERRRQCLYHIDEGNSITIIPFSLDGLPPAPKPLNAKIDAWFEPTRDALDKFEKHIADKQVQEEADSPNFLIAAFAPIAANIYCNLSNSYKQRDNSEQEIELLIIQWLKDQSIEHVLFSSLKQPTKSIMNQLVGMAIGVDKISLDYCIGQVWRHCQPRIYRALSFNACSDKVIAEIIKLDESTKRYSFGPPVESIQQLLALQKVGFLNLNMVNDPDIQLTSDGWKLSSYRNSATAMIMIDSVVDSAKLKSVDSSLVKGMLDDGLMDIVHDDFGVRTDEHAFLFSKNETKKLPIALLGRLAKGTIIGVDAILECFGSRPRKWANQAVKNHINWLEKSV